MVGSELLAAVILRTNCTGVNSYLSDLAPINLIIIIIIIIIIASYDSEEI